MLAIATVTRTLFRITEAVCSKLFVLTRLSSADYSLSAFHWTGRLLIHSAPTWLSLMCCFVEEELFLIAYSSTSLLRFAVLLIARFAFQRNPVVSLYYGMFAISNYYNLPVMEGVLRSVIANVPLLNCKIKNLLWSLLSKNTELLSTK